MSWKQIVAQVAPTIGTALGGPLGGMAAAAICGALGLPAGSKDTDIEKQLVGNPDKLLELKKADIAFQQRLAELEIDLEKVHAEDRSSARQREVQIKDKMPAVLAVAVVLLFAITLGWMLAYGLPESGGEALLIMLGTLGAAFGAIVQYYYGSSSGSEQKNSILAMVARK